MLNSVLRVALKRESKIERLGVAFRTVQAEVETAVPELFGVGLDLHAARRLEKMPDNDAGPLTTGGLRRRLGHGNHVRGRQHKHGRRGNDLRRRLAQTAMAAPTGGNRQISGA